MIKEEAKDYLRFSPLGKKVFAIVDTVWRGIYHLPNTVQFKTDWSNTVYIEFCLEHGLATYDANKLTELVILCHDEMVRMEIEPCMRYIRFRFHQRKGREGSFGERHPTIEDAISDIREVHKGRCSWSSLVEFYSE